MLLKKEGKIMFVGNPVLFSKVRRERWIDRDRKGYYTFTWGAHE